MLLFAGVRVHEPNTMGNGAFQNDFVKKLFCFATDYLIETDQFQFIFFRLGICQIECFVCLLSIKNNIRRCSMINFSIFILHSPSHP